MGGQGGYYALTGLWPIVHLTSFEAVTGPKADDWLVHTVGLLATAIGIVLGIAALRGEARTLTAVSLAVGSALAFAGIDLYYGVGGRIPPIYLADAVIEFGWLLLLGLTRSTKPSAHQPPTAS
jgi:ABC-type branched-subunit amino acid transport system permease subunit